MANVEVLYKGEVLGSIPQENEGVVSCNGDTMEDDITIRVPAMGGGGSLPTTFSIDGTTYNLTSGMTWQDFVNTHSDFTVVESNFIKTNNYEFLFDVESERFVIAGSQIIGGRDYKLCGKLNTPYCGLFNAPTSVELLIEPYIVGVDVDIYGGEINIGNSKTVSNLATKSAWVVGSNNSLTGQYLSYLQTRIGTNVIFAFGRVFAAQKSATVKKIVFLIADLDGATETNHREILSRTVTTSDGVLEICEYDCEIDIAVTDDVSDVWTNKSLITKETTYPSRYHYASSTSTVQAGYHKHNIYAAFICR